MRTSSPAIRFLQQRAIDHTLQPTAYGALQQEAQASGIAARQFARALLLQDEKGLLLAVLPLDHSINFARLRLLTGRTMQPAERELVQPLFSDCDEGILPPLPLPLGLGVVVDESLLHQESVYFESGRQGELVRVNGSDFQRLHHSSRWGAIATPAGGLNLSPAELFAGSPQSRHPGIRELRPSAGLKQRLQQLRHLPPVNNLTLELLQLYHDPGATVARLAQIIGTDPSLSAQTLRQARSAYYGFRGEIDSVEDAITQVLGFDTVIATALALSTGRRFAIPNEGGLGRAALWRHSLYSANLCRLLASQLPRQVALRPGVAYLSGLMQNMGLFVLGHILKPEYFLLRRLAEANPAIPLSQLERHSLGINHSQIGSWLMRAWRMPEVLQVTMEEHHNTSYDGHHADYVLLLRLANTLLSPYGIGDTGAEEPSDTTLAALGLDRPQVLSAVAHLMAQQEALDHLAAVLAT